MACCGPPRARRCTSRRQTVCSRCWGTWVSTQCCRSCCSSSCSATSITARKRPWTTTTQRSAEERHSMEKIWFIPVSIMLVGYVVLDGFDLGAGALHLFAARTEEERRAVLRSIGPVWDGNEVWLVAAGGTLFYAFPLLYASSFSGFYLALNIVLWLLIFRALGIELRGHVADPLWRAFFDGLFSISSLLLIVFFGAAFGNVVRGVPFGPDRYFFLPLWTDFQTGPEPGILDWYTVLCAVVTVVAVTMHGALYLIVKTEGAINRRLHGFVKWLWPA